MTNGEVQRRKHTEQEMRLRRKNEKASKATDSHAEDKRGVREEVQGKVLGGTYSSSKDEQEKDLQSWTNELEKVAQEEEREARGFRKRKGWAEKTLSLVAVKPGTRSSS